MIKVIVLIPITYNDGRRVPLEFFRKFEDQLIEICGGYSIDGITAGGWKDNNELYRDRSKRYMIAAKTNREVKQLKELVIKVGKELGQKSMYFETIPDSKIQILKVQ